MSRSRSYTVSMTISVEEDKNDKELDDIAESFLVELENSYRPDFSVELNIVDHGQ